MLEREGFHRDKWSHGGLADAFATELIKKRNLYPKSFRDFLVTAYAERITACYRQGTVGKKLTQRTLGHAKEFLTKVEKVTAR